MKKQANKVIANVLNRVAGRMAMSEVKAMREEYHARMLNNDMRLERMTEARAERTEQSDEEALRVRQEILLTKVEMRREELDLSLQMRRKADSIPQYRYDEIGLKRTKYVNYVKHSRKMHEKATKELQEVTEQLNDILFMKAIMKASETLCTKLND